MYHCHKSTLSVFDAAVPLEKRQLAQSVKSVQQKYVITIINILTSVIFIMITIIRLEKLQLAVAQSVASIRRGRESHF